MKNRAKYERLRIVGKITKIPEEIIVGKEGAIKEKAPFKPVGYTTKGPIKRPHPFTVF